MILRPDFLALLNPFWVCDKWIILAFSFWKLVYLSEIKPRNQVGWGIQVEDLNVLGKTQTFTTLVDVLLFWLKFTQNLLKWSNQQISEKINNIINLSKVQKMLQTRHKLMIQKLRGISFYRTWNVRLSLKNFKYANRLLRSAVYY